MDSRFSTAAFAATSTPRKNTRISRKAIATTTAMICGSRLEIMSRKSTCAAVVPVTSPRAAVPARARGSTWSESRPTRRVVAASCGALAGRTVATSTSPSAVGRHGDTAAAPGTCANAVLRRVSRAGRPAAGTAPRSTTTVSGPLAPGPNAVEIRS